MRELVAAGRAGGGAPGAAGPPRPKARRPPGPADAAGATEYERLGVRPTPDDGARLGAAAPWDESTRPHRPPSGPEVAYTRRGRLVGQHLIDVHDMLRRELTELRDIVAQVRDGALAAGDARSALNEMALRQNDWTLGAFCARYCGVVAQHHGLEDDADLPAPGPSEPGLGPVIDRLTDEHQVIHDAIEDVDRGAGAPHHPPRRLRPHRGRDRRAHRRAAVAPLLRGARAGRAAGPARLPPGRSRESKRRGPRRSGAL